MFQGSYIILFLISGITLLFTLLFFITISGVFQAWLKYWMGDDTALKEGFGKFNPLVHIDEVWMIIFFITRIFVRSIQPMNIFWEKGIKGFFQKIIVFFTSPVLHFIISSILLLIGVKAFSTPFFFLALQTPLSISVDFLQGIMATYVNLKGIKLIVLILLLYSIAMNMMLGLLDLFIAILDYFFRTFIKPYFNNFNVAIGSYLIMMFILIYFSNTFHYISWMIVSYPVIKLLG
jgi:hypothetical protein